MTLDPFTKKLLRHIGIAAGIIAILASFIMALNMDINRRVVAISDARSALALRSRTIELLTGTNTDLKKAEPLLASMQSLLPTKDLLINFPRELQKAAKNYLVDVGFSFGVERPPEKGQPGGIKFTMTVAGDYEGILDFLQFVETHRYLITLESVDVRRAAQTGFSLLTSGEIYTN